MTCIVYVDHNFKPASEAQIATAAGIIQEFGADGYTLTLRQLYYQFVARDLIENTERSYKNLGSLITKAREAGLLSWEAIEDRNRQHMAWTFEEDPREVLRDLEYGVTVDRWARQDHYVEVWIEKEALSNVIQRPCDRWAVPHMACKGYLSASEAWRAGQRFEIARARGKIPVLLHLGDHDPSGVDMTRDNADRLFMFSNFEPVEVRRLALNIDQVERYRPPPNPAKVTDSRAGPYIRRFGRTSWELDALEPRVIDELIDTEIRGLIDADAWNACRQEEEEKRKHLRLVHGRWDLIRDFLDDLEDTDGES